MQTNNPTPDPDDDTLADETVDAGDESDTGHDDGTEFRLLVPHGDTRNDRPLAVDWADSELRLGDDWAAEITSAVAASYVADDEAGPVRGSFARSTSMTFTGQFNIDLVVRLTPQADAVPGDDHYRRLLNILKHWRNTADGQPAPRVELTIAAPRYSPRPSSREDQTAQAAGWVASRAVRAALEARDAVVRGDGQSSHEVVAGYVSQWLGLNPTRPMVEAAGNALLQAPLDPHDPSPDTDVVKRLRSATFRQRRAWRPIGETWLRGRRVDALDRPLRLVTDNEALTMADTVGAEDQYAADLDGWRDHRIARVLTQLRDDERDVAMMYAHDAITTWGDAARACGRPEVFGERVRRKLLRLGKRLTARLAAQGLSPRAA
ncbi:hypothetical protein [Micromonospora aurantiaca (nom. illeg.)]|uniref:hypothetical protein n=1 Tax=Micromonospora aurantiaca (nom. illeg.) TaxID=47850 RepID=UPI003650B89D